MEQSLIILSTTLAKIMSELPLRQIRQLSSNSSKLPTKFWQICHFCHCLHFWTYLKIFGVAYHVALNFLWVSNFVVFFPTKNKVLGEIYRTLRTVFDHIPNTSKFIKKILCYMYMQALFSMFGNVVKHSFFVFDM